ncbi:MAG: glycosyltransferase family 4 protein [Candidatus Delongbacteria bacterium]
MRKAPVCISNGPLVVDGPRVLVNQHTGRFLEELSGLTGPLRVFQYLLRKTDRQDFGGLLDYDISGQPGLRPEGLVYHAANPLLKAVDRLRLYLQLPWLLRGTAWTYCFLPGTLPMYAAGVCRLLGVPYGVYVRGQLQVASRRTQQVLAHARLVVSNNSHTAAELAPYCRRPLVAPPMMAVGPADVVGERNGRRSSPPRVLFVGRIEAPKGVRELYQALDQLAREGAEFQLELVGLGPLGSPSQLPPALRARTTFAGFISDKQELAARYLAADLLVLPTHDEGFPRVLYEAMTYGLPSLTTFVGGIPSLMRAEENCLRCEPRDTASLADGLRRLLADPELRERLSAGARATIRAFHERSGESHARLVHREMSTP